MAAALVISAHATAAPFPTRDLNPLLAGYGLPSALPARLAGESWSVATDLNWASTSLVQRADGEQLSDADNRYADLISWDIIEVHLRGGVLEARATQPNPALQSVTPPPTTPAAGE